MSQGNTGHGHVYERPDGMVARCGGPGICGECSKDQVRKDAEERAAKVTPITPGGPFEKTYVDHVTFRVSGGRTGNHPDPTVLIGRRYPVRVWTEQVVLGTIVDARRDAKGIVLRVGCQVEVMRPADVVDFGTGKGFGHGTKTEAVDW